MPTPSTAKWPKPRSEDEFEDIVVDFVRMRWKDPNAQRHGRRGQRQHGVDVVGHPPWLSGRTAAAQCKNTESLSLSDVTAEVAKASLFQGGVSEFYIVTAADRDAALQSAVREHYRLNPAPFHVEVLFWPNVVADLSGGEALVAKHWKGFVPRQPSYESRASVSSRFGVPTWIDREGARANELTECNSEFAIFSPAFSAIDATELAAAVERIISERPRDYVASFLLKQVPKREVDAFIWSASNRPYDNVFDKWQLEIGTGSSMVRRWSSFSTHDQLLFETLDLVDNVVQPLLTYEQVLTKSEIRSFGSGAVATVEMRLSVFATKPPRLHDTANVLGGATRYSSPVSAESWRVELTDELHLGVHQIALRLLNRAVAQFRFEDVKEPSFAREMRSSNLVRLDESAFSAYLGKA